MYINRYQILMNTLSDLVLLSLCKCTYTKKTDTPQTPNVDDGPVTVHENIVGAAGNWQTSTLSSSTPSSSIENRNPSEVIPNSDFGGIEVGVDSGVENSTNVGTNEADGCIEQEFYKDNDNDGFGDPASAIQSCEQPEGYVVDSGDCDDSCDSCHPYGTETCNEKDDNCDGSVDEGCTCTSGQEQPCGIDTGECEMGSQTCSEGQWGECIGGVEKVDEICNDLDDDCDGETDELPDLICGTDVGACEWGVESCINGVWRCNGGVQPLPAEVCDTAGVDENCNGQINEGCYCGNSRCECNEGDTR